MKQRYFLMYLALLVAQLLISNFFRLTPYVMLSILPVMVLCIPTRYSTSTALLAAFATGLAVDLLAEGCPGLNILALVPVAYVRSSVCRAIFGDELEVRQEDFSFRKYGAPKVVFAISIAQALFLLIYIWADGASARSLSFSLLRFAASLAAGVLLSVPIAEILTPDDRK